MIVLAILEYFASKIGGQVGKRWFYEQDPVDPQTGRPNADGVYAVSVSALREQGQDYHQYIGLYVVIAKPVDDGHGHVMGAKEATDQLADAIETTTVNALDDIDSYNLTVAETGEKFTDVRLTPSSGRNTVEISTNGAVVKHLEVEVWYKKGY